MKAFSSLGMNTFLSLLSYADMAIGNSSSGIIEAPSFNIPTINIGDRQKGRMQAASIINTRTEKDDIVRSIKKACSTQLREACMHVQNECFSYRTSYRQGLL